MRRLILILAVLVLLPAAFALAAGGGEKSAAAAGAQPAPVEFMLYMGHVATDEQWTRIHDYVEQQTGVKFTYRDVPDADSYTTQLTAAIAAQEPIDVFWLGNKVDLANFKQRGAIQDITDAVNKYGPNIKKLFTQAPGWSGLQPGEMWKSVTVNGRIWATPSASSTNVGVVMSVRKDWREKLGLGPITTIDQFETYLRKVKDADLDGNGKADTIPYLDLYGRDIEGTASSLTYAFTGSSGWMHLWYSPTYKTPDGGLATTIVHPKFKDFLQRMRQWYKDGLLYKDTLTTTWDGGNDLLAANRVAAISCWYSDFFSAWETLVRTVPGADYEIVIFKGVDGSPAKFTLNDPAAPGWGYTSWSKLAPYAIALQDWFAASKDNYIVQVHGVQTTDWTWVNKDANEIAKVDGALYAYKFMSYAPWNGVPTGGEVTFGAAKRTAANRFLAKQTGVWWPDWYIAYDWKGTPIEKSYTDASTLINEAIANYILGRSTDADWDSVLAQYKTMWADEFGKEASAIFKAAK